MKAITTIDLLPPPDYNGIRMDSLVNIIRCGGVVAFPTETVYGLGADAWNPDAVAAVFSLKGRPADNPLIVHVADTAGVWEFAEDTSEDAQKLMAAYWPGPLTLILKKKPAVLDAVTGGLSTVAIRVPDHPLALELIRLAGPLVGPSANKSGRPSPTTAAHVREDFGADFPVLDGGPCGIGLESTVLDLTRPPYTVYRPGAVSAEELEAHLHKPVRYYKSVGEKAGPPPSPGLKYTHYAPKAEVFWLDLPLKRFDLQTLYLLDAGLKPPDAPANIIHYRGDYAAMARELYDRFRQADREGFTRIGIEPLTENSSEPSPAQGASLIQALINRISKAVGG